MPAIRKNFGDIRKHCILGVDLYTLLFCSIEGDLSMCQRKECWH